MSTAGCFYTKHVRLNALFPPLASNQNPSKCGILSLFITMTATGILAVTVFYLFFCADMKTEILFLVLINEKKLAFRTFHSSCN